MLPLARRRLRRPRPGRKIERAGSRRARARRAQQVSRRRSPVRPGAVASKAATPSAVERSSRAASSSRPCPPSPPVQARSPTADPSASSVRVPDRARARNCQLSHASRLGSSWPRRERSDLRTSPFKMRAAATPPCGAQRTRAQLSEGRPRPGRRRSTDGRGQPRREVADLCTAHVHAGAAG
jgi:hypothetical protein